MRFTGAVYRPPNEANSLLIQATIGCAWNKCTFCGMYKDEKFRVCPIEEIEEDLKNFQYKQLIESVFLCDGDAFVLSNNKLIDILKLIKRELPSVVKISSYATPNDILRKSGEELKELVGWGLDKLYVGLESGNDIVLEKINKGITRSQTIEACQRAQSNGFKLNMSLIAGLGGQELFEQHALDTASALTEIDPSECRLATLVLADGLPLTKEAEIGTFEPLTPKQSVEEIRILVENTNTTNCLFTTSHPSNHVHIKGYLPEDKERLLKEVDYLAKMI